MKPSEVTVVRQSNLTWLEYLFKPVFSSTEDISADAPTVDQNWGGSALGVLIPFFRFTHSHQSVDSVT